MKCLKSLGIVMMMLSFTTLSAGNSLITLNEGGDSGLRPKVVNFVILSCMWEIGYGFVKSTEMWEVFRKSFFVGENLEVSSSVVLHPPILAEKKGVALAEETGAIESSLKRSPAASKLCMLENTSISDDVKTTQDDNFPPSIILPPAFTDEEHDLSISSQLPNRSRSISSDGEWGFYGNISPGGRFHKCHPITVH